MSNVEHVYSIHGSISIKELGHDEVSREQVAAIQFKLRKAIREAFEDEDFEVEVGPLGVTHEEREF